MTNNQPKPVAIKKLGIATLAIMNIVAVVSLRGLPAEAEYGLSSIFYYIFAAIFSLFLFHWWRLNSQRVGPRKAVFSVGLVRHLALDGLF